MSIQKSTFVAGFAMFSMFFGSGNLVFPMILGAAAGEDLLVTIIPWTLTAVFIPLIGLFGMIQAGGDRHVYFNRLPKKVTFSLTFMLLALIGPFGVVPRCITVSYGGFAHMFPQLPLWAFSAVFSIIILLLIWNSNKIIDIIGKVLTPLKLGGIALLILVGAWSSPPLGPSHHTTQELLSLSLKSGYNTMDLLAGFFFAGPIMLYLKKHSGNDRRNLLKQGVWASIIAGFILSVVYLGLINLAAHYSRELIHVAPESMLAAVTQKALGDYATPITSLVIAFSCLATATILSSIWADFMRDQLLQKKISRLASIIISIALAFSMSLLGFDQIATILSTVLKWIYPLLLIYGIYKLIDYVKAKQ